MCSCSHSHGRCKCHHFDMGWVHSHRCLKERKKRRRFGEGLQNNQSGRLHLRFDYKQVSKSCAERSRAAPKRGLASLVGHTLIVCRMPVVGLFLVPKRRWKDLRKLGVRNLAQYAKKNVPLPAFFHPTFTSSILSAMFTGACGPTGKPSLALVPRSYVLRMIVKLAY